MSASSLFDPAVYVSLAFLFGIAAQFRAMDGYSFLRRVLAALEPRVGILFGVAAVTFVFSPFILNDVLVLILTPAIIKYARQYNLDASPLIVAEITFTNISSSLTPIGNPQNILLWTSTGIGFLAFVRGTWLLLALSAAIAVVALVPAARRMGGPRDPPAPLGSLAPVYYLVVVTAFVLATDFAGFPTYVPLGAGFAVGFAFNSKNLSQVRKEYDVRSLFILYFFIASVAAVAYFLTPFLAPFVVPVARGDEPYSGLFFASASNLISNVPATQLVLNTAGVTAGLAPKMAVEAGLAGNLGPIASFANLLALQMASKSGVSVKRTLAFQVVVGVLAYLPALA